MNTIIPYQVKHSIGSALIFSLLILLVTSILVTSMIDESILELKMASNIEYGIKTFQISDSKINQAISAITNNNSTNLLLTNRKPDDPCKTFKNNLAVSRTETKTSADVSICTKGIAHTIGSSMGRFRNYQFELKSTGKISGVNVSNHLTQGISVGPYPVIH